MNRCDAGSVFIETIIAAAIVSLALGTMYHTLGKSIENNRLVQDRRTAMLIAQSELAAVGSAIPVAAGDSAGTEGSYVWRVHIEPYAAAGDLWQVTITVGKQGSDQLATLRSLRLSGAS